MTASAAISPLDRASTIQARHSGARQPHAGAAHVGRAARRTPRATILTGLVQHPPPPPRVHAHACSVIKPASGGTTFGNSRVKRELFSFKAKAAHSPGPGAYEAGVSAAPHPPPFGAKASAVFASRVPMEHQRLLDSEKLLPGPGMYNKPGSMAAKAIPENLQTFGSTQKRLASDAATPNERAILAQPGPGAYEERRSDFRKVCVCVVVVVVGPPPPIRARPSGRRSGTPPHSAAR